MVIQNDVKSIEEMGSMKSFIPSCMVWLKNWDTCRCYKRAIKFIKVINIKGPTSEAQPSAIRILLLIL